MSSSTGTGTVAVLNIGGSDSLYHAHQPTSSQNTTHAANGRIKRKFMKPLGNLYSSCHLQHHRHVKKGPERFPTPAKGRTGYIFA